MSDAGASSDRPGRAASWRGELAADLAVMAAAGAFFAAIGPFDTDTAPAAARALYWMGVMLAGGLVVFGAERIVRALAPAAPDWAVAALTALAATPVQTGVVVAAGALVFGYTPRWAIYVELLPAVLVVTLAAVGTLALARLARRRSGEAAWNGTPPEEAPGDDMLPPAAIATRLPARLRGSPLIALQAEDHYVRVHTEAGSDLVLMRFADALEAVEAGAAGHRLHRSWWARADAIEAASYRRGTGQAQLKAGLTAPVSRTYAPALRRAGLL
ncbi:MAG: LytTR family transcriptional regulator DNA-binding domain-containing protein [Oceanicaulis sp.]